MIDTLAIVGVGLVGGSVALAARARGVARRIVGVAPPGNRTASSRALVDVLSTDIGPEVLAADLVIICTPVDLISKLAQQVLETSSVAVVSDVGSTKAEIVREVEAQCTGAARFVGGHPLAGSDRSGPEHATATLFDNRPTFLTPTKLTDPETSRCVAKFWKQLGAEVWFVDADDHDSTLAVTSHLPHLTAFALAGLVPPDALVYVGTGLRDTTRLAGSDPALWAGIALSNREHLLAALDGFQDRLDAVRTALANRDERRLVQLFDDGRKGRHALGS